MDRVEPTAIEEAGPRRWWREAALIGLLALVLNLAGNGRISLWDRDEPRYAGCTREMRQSGDLVFPTFNAEPRFHKPVLIYWLMLAGTAIGGDNPFGARLVSSVAGAAVVLMTWGLGRRMFGPREGRWAAIALATAPIMVAESKLATTDATLLVWFVGCQWAVWELSRGPSRRATAAFWACLGLSILTKGPIGPLLLAGAALMTWWWGGPMAGWRRLLGPLRPDATGLDEGRRFREAIARGWLRAPFALLGTALTLTARVGGRWLARNWGPLLCAAIVLPWYVAIGIRSEGAFYSVAWGYHVLKRATAAIETHGGFPGYYVAVSLVLFFPWSALMPAALVGLWRRRRSCAASAFVLGWIVGPLVILELVRTKLIHYYLPAYPACALAAGWLIPAVTRSELNLRRWSLGTASLGLLAGIGVVWTVGGLAGAVVLPGALRWSLLVTALIIGAATVYAVDRLRQGATERAASTLAASWSAVLLVLFAWFLPAFEPYRLPQKVARALAAIEASEGARPVLSTFKPPGVVYEIRHPVPIVDNRIDLDRMARAEGTLVAPLNDMEVWALMTRSRLLIEPRGTVEGFNVERFRHEKLGLYLIHPGPEPGSTEAAPAATVARGIRDERAVRAGLVE